MGVCVGGGGGCSKIALSLHVSQRCLAGTAKKCLILSAEQSKKNNFLPVFVNLFSLKVSLSLFLSQYMNIRKKYLFQQALSIKSGAKTKN